MSFAGVTNVACGTIFKDDKGVISKSFEFKIIVHIQILPRLLTTFEVETKIKNKDIEFDILYAHILPSSITLCPFRTVIQECSAGKPLIAAVNGSHLIAEDLLIKQFDIDAKRAEVSSVLRLSSLIVLRSDEAKVD